MKKFLAMLLSLTMVSSLAVPVFAADEAETASKLGEVTVNITKVWDDKGHENERPKSITVNIGEEKVELSANNGWEASVVVYAFDAEGKLESYDVSEDKVDKYTTEIAPETLEMQGFAEFTDLIKVPNCETTKKYFDKNQNMVVFKKGDDFVVWTAQELTEGAQKALVSALEKSKEDLANMNSVSFASGFGVFDLRGQDVSISSEGQIQFEGKSTWSWFYYGTVAMEQDAYDVTVTNTYDAEPEYEWVQIGSDSATGYDCKNKVEGGKKSWFMYNKVDVAGWEDGKSETFDIQAGNDKNRTNFVGTYTVTKTNENEFVISYKVKDDYYGDDTSKKLQFDGMNLWYNGTGVFVNSPGNQKGKATAAKVGEAFTFEEATLYVFAHFNVSYWEYVPVAE